MTVLVHMYLANNLGDDLFIKLLLERYPKVEFKFLHDNKKYSILDRYSNASIVLIPKLNRFHFAFARFFNAKVAFKLYFKQIKQILNKESKSSDGFLILGGSLFMEGKNEYSKKQFYNIIYDEFENKQKFIIGSNFGPYRNEDYKLFFRSIFSKSTDVCFRDIYSYKLFSEVATVRYSPDAVFELRPISHNKEKKSVGFIPISLKNRPELSEHEKSYNNFFAQLMLKFLENEYNVSLYSFCENEGDLEAVSNIMKLLGDKMDRGINIVNYNGENMEFFLSQLSNDSYLVCSRFHSMILGLINQQNIYPITYSKKMNNVLEDIHFTGEYTSISELSSLNVENVYNQILDNEFDVSHFLTSNDNQFRILDNYLR